MLFLRLIHREMQTSLPRFLVMSAISGASNAGILAAVNAGSSARQSDGPSYWAFGLFGISLLLYMNTQRYIITTSAIEIEAVAHRIRLRLINSVLASELLSVDRIGQPRLLATISNDTTVLKQASRSLTFGSQSVVLMFFIVLYVAYISFVAFALSVVLIGTSAAIMHLKNRELKHWMNEAGEWNARFFGRLGDLVQGFKEVRLNTTRQRGLGDDLVEVSRTAANIKIWTDAESAKQMVFTQSSFFLLLGSVVFVAPLFSSQADGSGTSEIVTALLFIFGACFGVVQALPALFAADAAAERIDRLEADLRKSAIPAAPPDAASSEFRRLEMKGIVYTHTDKSEAASFQVGPIDFVLGPGEIVFIVGGNGSGKSTFLKLIAGLLKPDAGEMFLNGEQVDDRDRDRYRQCFSAVFADYHLFRRLYATPDPEPAELDRLMDEFELANKTRLVAGEFETLDLSGGQRKRLALIASLLERRPIILLDEWTSDQDPVFRHKFYETLLPNFIEEGRTVVVVTHDARYIDKFALHARLLRMHDGRFVAS